MNVEHKGIHPSDKGIASYIGDSVYAIGDGYNIICSNGKYADKDTSNMFDAFLWGLAKGGFEP